MIAALSALLQIILAFFRRAERKDHEAAGAAKAAKETSDRADKLIREGEAAKDEVDHRVEAIVKDPNNRLNR